MWNIVYQGEGIKPVQQIVQYDMFNSTETVIMTIVNQQIQHNTKENM